MVPGCTRVLPWGRGVDLWASTNFDGRGNLPHGAETHPDQSILKRKPGWQCFCQHTRDPGDPDGIWNKCNTSGKTPGLQLPTATARGVFLFSALSLHLERLGCFLHLGRCPPSALSPCARTG